MQPPPKFTERTLFFLFSFPQISIDEKSFRYAMNDDEMANDKLSEGIRKFAADQVGVGRKKRERKVWMWILGFGCKCG